MAQIEGEVFHDYVQGSQNLESCNFLEESMVVMHNGAREELKNADSLIGIGPSSSESDMVWDKIREEITYFFRRTQHSKHSCLDQFLV